MLHIMINSLFLFQTAIGKDVTLHVSANNNAMVKIKIKKEREKNNK